MSKKIKLKKPIINKDDIYINCNHTEELALMKIDTKDQKGLFSYIAKILDDFNIEINSAKIQSINQRAKDLLLITKDGNFCNNKDEIMHLVCV
jgi:[protein-PII] uridylyltransferase